MSQSEKFNAETSLKMLEKAAEEMREFLQTGEAGKAQAAEFFARNAHKSSVALFNSTHENNPLAIRKVA